MTINNKELERLIIEELSLLFEQTSVDMKSGLVPRGIVPSVRKTESERTGASLVHANKRVIEIVYLIQKKLNEKGHDPGELDGIFGPQTLAALKRAYGAYKPGE